MKVPIFVGRKRELATMESLYSTSSFEMLVLYGRRRVGKTSLIEEFAKNKNVLYFTAQLQADADNLFDFSHMVIARFDPPESTPPFASWVDAFAFISDRARENRLVVVIDEFPYACKSNPGLSSTFQISINRYFKSTNIFLTLCDSGQGFMESEVLGEKSPLYGRRTAQIKLKPFDFIEAARMMPDCSPEDKMSYYASLGGTPYYLEGIKDDLSYSENMATLYFFPTGRMFDEPSMLMRQELREPLVFSSVMRAIASGANKHVQIANAVGISQGSLGFYLKSLVSLGLIEKIVPFGESERSKRGIYRICDPAFLFWYRFVAPYASVVEKGLGRNLAVRLLSDSSERRSEYEGHLFERICAEWLIRQGIAHRLPLEMTAIGSWWRADPVTHQTCDIDIVAADDLDKKLLVGECKWRNSINETKVLETLSDRCRLIPGYHVYERYLFTKHPVSKATRTHAASDTQLHLISVDDLYADL